jgi:hypothetical protein
LLLTEQLIGVEEATDIFNALSSLVCRVAVVAIIQSTERLCAAAVRQQELPGISPITETPLAPALVEHVSNLGILVVIS